MDVEPESAAPFGNESQDVRLFVQAAAQENQARLEAVLDIWQLERLVEANLAVRELHTLVNREQLPQDPSCYPFDQILVVHEHAVVGSIVFDRRRHACRRPGHWTQFGRMFSG